MARIGAPCCSVGEISGQSTRIEVTQGVIVRNAQLRYQDLDRNLCQLTIDAPFPNAIPLSVMIPSTALEIGQTAYSMGSPFGQDLTIVRGMIAGTKDKPGDAAKPIQTDVAVTPGSTGGGLFDQDARLIGIITSGLIDAQNLNLALPTEWVAELGKRNVDRISANLNVETPEQHALPAPTPADSSTLDFKSGARWRYRFSTGGRDRGSVVIQAMSVNGDKIKVHHNSSYPVSTSASPCA